MRKTVCEPVSKSVVGVGVNTKINRNSGNWIQTFFSVLFVASILRFARSNFIFVKCRWIGVEYRSMCCAVDVTEYLPQMPNRSPKWKTVNFMNKKKIKKFKIEKENRNKYGNKSFCAPYTQHMCCRLMASICVRRFQLPWGILCIILRINRLPRLNSTTI